MCGEGNDGLGSSWDPYFILLMRASPSSRRPIRVHCWADACEISREMCPPYVGQGTQTGKQEKENLHETRMTGTSPPSPLAV